MYLGGCIYSVIRILQPINHLVLSWWTIHWILSLLCSSMLFITGNVKQKCHYCHCEWLHFICHAVHKCSNMQQIMNEYYKTTILVLYYNLYGLWLLLLSPFSSSYFCFCLPKLTATNHFHHYPLPSSYYNFCSFFMIWRFLRFACFVCLFKPIAPFFPCVCSNYS